MKIHCRNRDIRTLEEWREIVFTGKKEIHWKEGRSAYALADFVLNKDGLSVVKQMVSSVINEGFEFTSAIPEYEARFDKYGHGREHDLGIFGSTVTGKNLFIGVESKVDESFGSTIGTAYVKAKTKELNGKKTNAPQRIERLLETTFSNVLESDFGLRYQLLFSSAGTLSIDADIHVFLVLVFKTHLYDPELGSKNEKDLMAFLKRIKAQEMNKGHFKASIDNKELHVIYKEIECQTLHG
ncbi:MAG TPA: hypothetical protein GXZ39_00820 [Bacteroidales bacterium]|nr:hypothetical protein [Bacteroidales bacterium]